MTLLSSIARITYTGNGSTTAFATNFKLLDESHVAVYVDDDLKTITTDYTISGVGNNTATVTFVTAPAASTTVVLKLDVPLTQEVDLVDGQVFSADTIESSLDLGTQVDQSLAEQLNRSLKAPLTAPTDFDGTIQALTPEYILRVNTDGDGFEVSAPATAAGVGSLGAQESNNVGITGGTITGLTELSVSGDITVTGTVDGTDIAALKTDVDGFPDGLKSLTSDEITQLQNIDTSAISSAQWGYLGALTAAPISSLEDDLGATLGSNLDVNSFIITSSSNGDVEIDPDGTGSVIINGLTYPASDGSAGQIIQTDGLGNLSFTSGSGGGGLGDIVDDTSPQLGGMLDNNSFGIGDGTRLIVNFTEDPSAVNYINIENEATGSGPTIRSAGSDTNVDLNIESKGTGVINLVDNTDVGGTLDVTGAATLDSTLTVNGATTLSSTLQLGGQLDTNGQAFGDGTRELLTFTEDGSAVNHINIENEATGSGPTIRSAGDDTNVDLNLEGKGTGSVNISGLSYPTSDGTVDQVLKTDGSGNLSFADAGGSGGLVLVDSASPSGASSVEFTSIPTTYRNYILDIRITPSSTTFGRIRLSSDNGSTYISTSTYRVGSLLTSHNLFGGASIQASESSFCRVYLSNLTSAAETAFVEISGRYTSSTAFGSNISATNHESSTVMNALQIQMNSGTLSGEIRLYGVVDA